MRETQRVARVRLRQPPVCYGAQFTKYLTSYRKIIANLSSDRLTIVTYNVLELLLGIS